MGGAGVGSHSVEPWSRGVSMVGEIVGCERELKTVTGERGIA